MKYLVIISFIIISLFNNIVIAQDQYAELNVIAVEKKEISLKIKDIENRLTLFIKNSDTLNIANAYYVLSHLKPNHRITYADSIIAITENKNYFRYPALGYEQRGIAKFESGNYIESLEFYIKASESAKKKGDNQRHLLIEFNIGLLKSTAGDYEGSQITFINYIEFLEQNPEYKNEYNYNPALFALADSYIRTKDLDLAENIIRKGIKETLKIKDSINYSYLVVASGIHQHLTNRHQNAIDSLEKGKKIIKKFDPLINRIVSCDYYIGKSYLKLGNNKKSIQYFKSVDTILRKTKDVIPEIMDVYDYLKAYAKSINDHKLQIKYINTQLELESINHADQVYLTRNITKKYDNKALVSEKNKLIKELEEKTFLKNTVIIFLVIFSIILVLVTSYGFRKSYINKKHLQALLEKQKKAKENQAQHFSNAHNELVKKEDIDIPEEVVEKILKELHEFEKNNRFAKKHYTLNSLAKELHTNSAYLSKTINFYKNVNFSNYLNNLRIDFAIDQLTTNKSLQSYTIQAIAEEVGFKNAQSFSSAFYKKKRIYPSYFIKQIKI